jgi:hypothetical protein
MPLLLALVISCGKWADFGQPCTTGDDCLAHECYAVTADEEPYCTGSCESSEDCPHLPDRPECIYACDSEFGECDFDRIYCD